MARKQIIVQLDDELVRQLDAAALADGISRSEALRQAARAWLTAEEERQADRRHAEAYSRIPQGAEWDDDYARLSPQDLGDPRATGFVEAG